MRSSLLPCILFLLSACSTTSYYVVRHAEKEVAQGAMSGSSDVPLSTAGYKRAEALKEELKGRDIRYIFSTSTRRTLATAEPLHELYGLRMNLYNTRDTLGKFIARLKSIRKGNVLVVGHSNTVDDIVNGLTGKQSIIRDLDDSEYNNLFIVRRSGNRFKFHAKTYGDTAVSVSRKF